MAVLSRRQLRQCSRHGAGVQSGEPVAERHDLAGRLGPEERGKLRLDAAAAFLEGHGLVEIDEAFGLPPPFRPSVTCAAVSLTVPSPSTRTRSRSTISAGSAQASSVKASSAPVSRPESAMALVRR